jgi:hypothetical protein
VGYTFGKKYLGANPLEGKDKDGVRLVVEEHGKSETASLTLAGLALTGLTFILQTPNANSDLVAFFSIGIILESSSALFYRHLYKQSYPYLGFVSQYGGLLALFSGFFVYLTQGFSANPHILIIYSRVDYFLYLDWQRTNLIY